MAVISNSMLVGLDGFYLYSSLIFLNAGIPEENIPLVNIGTFSAQFVSGCVGVSELFKG